MDRRQFLTVATGAYLALLSHPARAAGNMKCYVQWAKANPQDWALTDAGLWLSSQTKADPVGDVSFAGLAIGDSLLTNQPGWVFAVDVQGVIFEWYDHYLIEDLTDGSLGTRVIAWRDDQILFPVGTRQADVAVFLPLAFDPRVGGINTRQTFVLYREGAEYDARIGNPPENTIILRYEDFAPPIAGAKHGIYLSDAKWDEHQAARTLHGWRDWIA